MTNFFDNVHSSRSDLDSMNGHKCAIFCKGMHSVTATLERFNESLVSFFSLYFLL